MTPEQLGELKDNATLRKRLAKAMAKHCFRNTKLEDLHGADRIDDEEMKALMIDVVDHCYDYLMELCKSAHAATFRRNAKGPNRAPSPGEQARRLCSCSGKLRFVYRLSRLARKHPGPALGPTLELGLQQGDMLDLLGGELLV